MRRMIAASLVLLASAGAAAQTPPPEYDWTQSRVSLTRAYAWATKARPEQGFHPMYRRQERREIPIRAKM